MRKVVPMLLCVTATPLRLDDGHGKQLILGESCLDGTLSVTVGSSEQFRSLAREPNLSLVVATARIADSGSLAISGACADVWVCRCGCAGVGEWVCICAHESA
eukprot:scaffold93386_cov14-Tisochrysis_lutea.AAC.1